MNIVQEKFTISMVLTNLKWNETLDRSLLLKIPLAVVPDFGFGHGQVMRTSVSAKMIQWRVMTSIRHPQTCRQIGLASTRGHRSNSTTISIKRSRSNIIWRLLVVMLTLRLLLRWILLRFCWVHDSFGQLNPPERNKGFESVSLITFSILHYCCLFHKLYAKSDLEW